LFVIGYVSHLCEVPDILVDLLEEIRKPIEDSQALVS